MPRNYYVSGGWNVICDSCGKKIKASEAKQRWDGLIVCPADFEMRQPQDFVKARQDRITVPFTRPRPTDVFTLVQGVNDPVPVIDVLTSQQAYQRTFADVVTMSDLPSIQRNLGFADTVYPQDGQGDAYIDPTYFLSDYIEPGGGFSIFVGKSRSDALTMADSIAKSLQLSETDAASLIEYVMDAYSKQTSDSLTLSDLASQIAAFNRTPTETVGLSDTFTNVLGFNRTVDDSITMSDSISIFKAILLAFADTVTMSDVFSKSAAFNRSASDSVTTSDSALVVPNKRPSDSVSMTDTGSIWFNDYIDPTYFASDYVGSYTNF